LAGRRITGPSSFLSFKHLIEKDELEAIDKIMHFLRVGQRHNLISADVIIDLQVNRKLTIPEQAGRLRVVDEGKDGIVSAQILLGDWDEPARRNPFTGIGVDRSPYVACFRGELCVEQLGQGVDAALEGRFAGYVGHLSTAENHFPTLAQASL
jgi:hypothetical protein